MTKPNYDALYADLLHSSEGEALWNKCMERIQSLRLQDMRSTPSKKVVVTFGTDASPNACERSLIVDDPFRKPTFSISSAIDWEGGHLVKRKEADFVIETHLGKEVPRHGCRKTIVMNGSGRSPSFRRWVNRRAARRVTTFIVDSMNGARTLQPEEMDVIDEWRENVSRMEKRALKQFIKNRHREAPADLLREAVEEFIVESVQSS